LRPSSNNGWKTSNKGSVSASANVSGGSIWLRCSADIAAKPSTASFSYSTDGSKFTGLGVTHKMADGAIFFVGTRYGIFNMGRKNLGGKIVLKSFTLAQG
jgi:hypothetical protein